MDSKELLDEEEEQLYLLEVVVNQLTVTKEGILDSMSEADFNVVNDIKTKKKEVKGPVRIKVKFFDFPTIEIEEEDFKSNENENPSTSVRSSKGETETMLEDAKREEERWRAKNAGMSLEMWRDERERDKKMATEIREMLPPGNRFTSGKSCLFPMMPNEMIKTIQKYPLEVQVIRMGPDKCPLHVIGQAKVELGASFREAVTVATTPVVLPISAFVEDRYDLVNVFGDTTGDVSLFVRLSCFGATIFTQFKQIQGDKGAMSKISEMTRAKKSACDKRKKKSQEKTEEEEEKRPPCMSLDEDFPSERQGISSRAPDDIFVPVMWRNINEPDVTMQFCSPRDLQMGSFDTNYRSGLANNQSVNMNRMFPGISHSVQKYDNDHIKCNVQCACSPSQNERSSKIKCMGLGAHGGKTNCTNLRSVDDTYVSENLETFDDVTANNTTSKAVSDLIDSDWELMVSGRSVKRKKPAYPAKANYNPLQRTANPNKPCPATADGRCRCPKELRNSKRPNTYGKSNIPCDNNTCGGFNETRAVLAGLPRLCDPVMQNISNVMPPNIMVPNMGPRSNVISICNCPKVPDFVPPGDMRGGNIRCECSNILTSIHPAQMPYTCPGSYTDPTGDMVRGQVAPCPIKIPEIPPEQMPQMVPTQVTRDQSLPSVVLSEDSSSDEDYHYVERKRHRKAKGGRKKKESDRDSSVTPKRHKKKKSINENSERTDFDTTAHKMLEEELDFYENMVEDVKKKAKGEGDAKDTKSKKESRSSVSKEKPKADEEKKDTTLYRYTAGMYPGVHIGHKDCVVPYRFVPKNMGWLWNIKSAAGVLKAGRGWRPGAIAESVAELMDAAKSSTYKKKKVRKGQSKGRKKKEEVKHPPKKTTKMLKEEKKEKDDDKTPEDLRPTLHVHKKHGLYYVSMYPPKKEDEQEPQPIQFKIDPKHPDGPGGDSELYESEESSTNTEDSFQLDFVAPHTLKGRVPVRNKIDMQCQVSSENIPVEQKVPSVIKIKTPKSKKSKKGKKKGKGKKKKGKKAKGKKGKGKSRKGKSRKGKKPKSRK